MLTAAPTVDRQPGGASGRVVRAAQWVGSAAFAVVFFVLVLRYANDMSLAVLNASGFA